MIIHSRDISTVCIKHHFAILLLIVLVFITLPCRAEMRIPPSQAEIMHLLFNLQKEKVPDSFLDFGQTCKAQTVACLLEGIMLTFAEEKDLSAMGSTSSCLWHDRTEYLTFIKNNPLFFKGFHQQLSEISEPGVWECRVQWYSKKINLEWSQEIRFSVLDNKTQVLKDSLAVINTP